MFRDFSRNNYNVKSVLLSCVVVCHVCSMLMVSSACVLQGITNLGNTCFFNSVMQVMSQTHLLTQLLDLQLQTGQRINLPGHPPDQGTGDSGSRGRSLDREGGDSDDDIELVGGGWWVLAGGAVWTGIGEIVTTILSWWGRDSDSGGRAQWKVGLNYGARRLVCWWEGGVGWCSYKPHLSYITTPYDLAVIVSRQL